MGDLTKVRKSNKTMVSLVASISRWALRIYHFSTIFSCFLARLDFRRSLESDLCSSPRVFCGEQRGLISRTAASNRAYFLACVAGARRGRGIGEIKRARVARRRGRIPLPFPHLAPTTQGQLFLNNLSLSGMKK